MSETFYVKKGRKYVPVSYLHDNLMDSLSKGCHLVIVMDGSTAYKMNINPDHAAILSALELGRDEISRAIDEAIKTRPNVNRELTKTEVKHWRALEKLFNTPMVAACPNVQYVLTAIEKAMVRIAKGVKS